MAKCAENRPHRLAAAQRIWERENDSIVYKQEELIKQGTQHFYSTCAISLISTVQRADDIRICTITSFMRYECEVKAKFGRGKNWLELLQTFVDDRNVAHWGKKKKKKKTDETNQIFMRFSLTYNWITLAGSRLWTDPCINQQLPPGFLIQLGEQQLTAAGFEQNCLRYYARHFSYMIAGIRTSAGAFKRIPPYDSVVTISYKILRVTLLSQESGPMA